MPKQFHFNYGFTIDKYVLKDTREEFVVGLSIHQYSVGILKFTAKGDVDGFGEQMFEVELILGDANVRLEPVFCMVTEDWLTSWMHDFDREIVDELEILMDEKLDILLDELTADSEPHWEEWS